MGPLALVQMREMEVSEEAVTMRSRGLSSSVDQHKWPNLHKFQRSGSIYWNWTSLWISKLSAGLLTTMISLSLLTINSHFVKHLPFERWPRAWNIDNLGKAIRGSHTTTHPRLGQSWMLGVKLSIFIFSQPFSASQPG